MSAAEHYWSGTGSETADALSSGPRGLSGALGIVPDDCSWLAELGSVTKVAKPVRLGLLGGQLDMAISDVPFYLPHLQALSASSPFWASESTGYASNRTLRFQQLPTAGLPWEVDDWAGVELVLEDLAKTGIIAEPTEARWDIRPAPKWGTLEVRFCDGASTLASIGALAALTQCLAEHYQRQADLGQPLPRLRPWFVRENKWRAARYGLDARHLFSRTNHGRRRGSG